MICAKPWKEGQLAGFPCNRCVACRLNKKRVWVHRLTLESKCHEFNTFATLTYSDEYLPPGDTLVLRHYQLFLKQLRERLRSVGRTCRYFLVGEYGDRTARPHYHAVLFGVSCSELDVVQSCWNRGHVRLDPLEPGLIRYACGYVVKHHTQPGTPGLRGRYPEFARMSRLPGLGVPFLDRLASQLCTKTGNTFLDQSGDVPTQLRTDGKLLPLGRTLTLKLRDTLGRDTLLPRDVALKREVETMQGLYRHTPEGKARLYDLDQERKQKARQLAGRQLIESTRKKDIL